MNDIVMFDVEGHSIGVEVAAGSDSLRPASASRLISMAERPFEAAIEMLGALAGKFAEAFKDRPVSSSEIKLHLKVTAKGDFIIVGSSAEAVLEVKLVIGPK